LLWTAILPFVTSAQSQSVDSLTTTSIWEFSKESLNESRGFGMILLFDDAIKAQVGAINFLCAVPQDPYLDIYAYKKELSVTNLERRWPVVTAHTVLRFENVSVPVSIERGFIFIDINSQTEYAVRRIFDIPSDQAAERVLHVPGFVKLKLAFRPKKIGSDKPDNIFVNFDEMLDLCKTARKSVMPTPKRNIPRR
jgi:hypothetical protein